MKGFTLVEILVALVLLAGLGIAALSAFSSSAQIVDTDQNVAYNFARSTVERLFEQVRQDTWGTDSLPLSLTTPGPQNITSTPAPTSPIFRASYQINGDPNTGTAAILDQDGDTLEDYRQVTATVCWPIGAADCP